MEISEGLVPAGEGLALVARILDRIDPDRAGVEAATRLEWVRAARKVSSRVQALAGLLTAEADRVAASETAAGTPMGTWLGIGENASRKETGGALRQARLLGAHPEVGNAAVAGRIGARQARAIAGVLDGLAPELDAPQQQAAEAVLLELAGHLDADQLAGASARVLRQVAPERAEETVARRLQRQAEAAHRERCLRFYRDPGSGSVRFDGSLPVKDAEAWITQLEAIMAAHRRTPADARDPFAALSPEQRRADALVSLVHARNAVGGAGARVLVRLDYGKLREGAVDAGVLRDDQLLPAGELRQLCCDASVIPVVLGSASEVLDVGREERFATPALRAALIARDGGCAFPGCDVPPHLCEAHHRDPWRLGGKTTLDDLALLCKPHHGVIEPATWGVRDQWELRMGDDGRPEFLPPARLDPERSPLRNTRHSRASGAA